jgi:hypothetical protein
MKDQDIIRMIDQLAREIASRHPVLTPDMPGFRPMEITFAPQSKYKFSRKWYVAVYNDNYYHEVVEWCTQHCGPHPNQSDAWSRWVHKYKDAIHFRDQEDYIMFKLRWGE